MLTEKVLLRKCVGCQEMLDRSGLIRVVKTPEGKIQIDPTAKQDGRGAYICRNEKCLAAALKRRSFDRSFKQAVGNDVYEALKKEI